MYKVKVAWIEQILEFDSEVEFVAYKEKLASGRPQIYRIVEEKSIENGKIILHIKKQYNNNAFPE